MDGLRWLLLVFGLLAVAGVYWYSRREASRPAAPEPGRRREPSLQGPAGDKSVDAGENAAAAHVEDGTTGEDVGEQEQPPEKIVTLRLVAAQQAAFSGDKLALGLRRVGMRHGKFGIFHCYEGDDEEQIVFSAASLVEPGSFDLANIREQNFPGISLFMVLPGPREGVQAFDLMMAAARELAKALNGELLDESGSTLSIQRERYLREEIIRYQHGIKVA